MGLEFSIYPSPIGPYNLNPYKNMTCFFYT